MHCHSIVTALDFPHVRDHGVKRPPPPKQKKKNTNQLQRSVVWGSCTRGGLEGVGCGFVGECGCAKNSGWIVWVAHTRGW